MNLLKVKNAVNEQYVYIVLESVTAFWQLSDRTQISLKDGNTILTDVKIEDMMRSIHTDQTYHIVKAK